MEKEIHVFIIWQNGLPVKEDIFKDMRSNFTIRQVFKINWPERDFSRHLARFYGKSLPKGCKKGNECGFGSFLLVVVEDKQPHYKDGKNRNVIAAKMRYRSLCNANFVHASDSIEEADENLSYILGMNRHSFDEMYPDVWNGEIIDVNAEKLEPASCFLTYFHEFLASLKQVFSRRKRF